MGRGRCFAWGGELAADARSGYKVMTCLLPAPAVRLCTTAIVEVASRDSSAT